MLGFGMGKQSFGKETEWQVSTRTYCGLSNTAQFAAYCQMQENTPCSNPNLECFWTLHLASTYCLFELSQLEIQPCNILAWIQRKIFLLTRNKWYKSISRKIRTQKAHRWMHLAFISIAIEWIAQLTTINRKRSTQFGMPRIICAKYG